MSANPRLPKKVETQNPEWLRRNALFEAECRTRGIDPNSYSQYFFLEKDWVIEAIGTDWYEPDFYFLRPEERQSRAIKFFDAQLSLRGIDPESYETLYRRNKSRIAILLITGVSLEEDFWFKPTLDPRDVVESAFEDYGIADSTDYKNKYGFRAIYARQWIKSRLPTSKKPGEVRALFLEMFFEGGITNIMKDLCAQHGCTIENYEKVYHNKNKFLVEYIIKYYDLVKARDEYRLERISSHFFTLDEKRKQRTESILSRARLCVEPGRTAGIGMLELGESLNRSVRGWYPNGLRGLNEDLGLNQIVHIPDFNQARENAPSVNEIRLESLKRKIDSLARNLDSESRIGRLRQEIAELEVQPDELQAVDINEGIFDKLESAILDSLDMSPGYLYFKQWGLSDATWFKIGVTNSPSRRDAEQNVLPVPSQTLALVRLDSMEQARSVEKAIHKVLETRRIRGAQNQELFQLSPGDYKAVLMVLRELSRLLNKID